MSDATRQARTLEEVISKALDYRLASLRVALPAKVVSYDPITQLVDVQPLIDSAIQIDDDTLTEPLPTLSGIPVAHLAGGGFAVAVPLAAGDTGMLVFADFSLDYWRGTGNQAAPQDLRTHSLANATFWPGLHDDKTPLQAASSSDLVVAYQATPLLTIKADGSILIGASASAACARNGDAVKATVPAGTFLVSCSGSPAVGVLNPAPIDLTGTITAGSAKVSVA
jgi:hypothetical protein